MKDFSPQTNLDNLVETLEEYGVSILPDVFTDEECETFKKKVFDHISSKFGVNKPDEFAKLRPVGGGILHNYGISLIEPCLTLKGHFGVDSRGKDWFAINKTTHYDWFIKKGCEWRTIVAPKGSLVLWDSRTIHMGTLPRENRPNSDRWRFVVYVCYTPASRQSPEDAKLKRFAYLNNQCTSHWPYGVRLFSKRIDDVTQNNLDSLTDRHRKYLGIDRVD